MLLWEHEKTQRILSFLEPNKQFVLNSYFATGKPGLSDEEALAYRKTRSNSEAFSAGKAFNELCRFLSEEKKRESGMRVYPLIRQEINVEGPTRALVMVCEEYKEVAFWAPSCFS